MKKLLVIILSIVTVFLMFGCSVGGEASQGQMTIIVDGGQEYKVDLSKVEVTEGVLSVLKYCAKENNLNIAVNGTMLTEFASLKQANDYYLWIETTCKKDFDLTTYATSRDYNDMHFVSSGLGVKDMTVEDGVYIYISLKYWGN